MIRRLPSTDKTKNYEAVSSDSTGTSATSMQYATADAPFESAEAPYNIEGVKAVLGADRTKRFFYDIFFAPHRFK